MGVHGFVVGLDRTYRPRRDVAYVDAVARFILCIGNPSEVASLLVKRKFGNVADVDLLSGREFAQKQIGTLGLIVMPSRASGCGRWWYYRSGIRSVFRQSDPSCGLG